MITGARGSHRLADDPVSGGACRTVRVGRRELLAFSDGVLLMHPHAVGTAEQPTAGHDELSRIYGEARFPVGCFVWPGERTTLIDCGLGPAHAADAASGGLLDRKLRAAELSRSDIDVIALSHLHFDHAGGIADPHTGLPRFPRAIVHVDRRDWEFFVDGDGGGVPLDPHVLAVLTALADDGRVQLDEGDGPIVPGLDRIAAPGHTPGHTVYVAHDGDERVYLLGDAMHCPQQLEELAWGSAFDEDSDLARNTRIHLARLMELSGGAALGCHFPTLSPFRTTTRKAP